MGEGRWLGIQPQPWTPGIRDPAATSKSGLVCLAPPSVSGRWVTGWGGRRMPLAGASCQEMKKLQEEEHSCSRGRSHPLMQSQSPPMQMQQQPQPPPPQPKQQNAQDRLIQGTSQHILQDSQRPGPQLGSVGTHQAGGQCNLFNKDKFHEGVMNPQGPGK